MTDSGGIVTILFTDVVNSTEVLTRVGDVRAEELRRSHFNELRDLIAEHHGREVKTMGDGFMVVFASAVDALNCAVAMQQTASLQAISLRVGINIGEPMREGDDYFGTPVVVASRLCAAASPGQILTSDLVRALVGSRGELAFHDAGFLALKGIPDPVAAWEIGWEPPVASSRVPYPPALGTGSRVPFVGRESELAQLLRDWKAARDGQRTVSLLAGEPGIGKTRLAAELASRAHEQGATVLFGRCDEEALVPYQPFVEAVSHIVGNVPANELTGLFGDAAADLARLAPTIYEHVPGLPEAMRSEPESDRYRVFEAVRTLFGALATRAPVVLVLDDLHWADKPSLLLLQHLLRPGTELPLHIVGTYRDTDLDRRHPLADTLADLRRQTGFERIALSGLGETDIDTFLDVVTGQDPPPGFALLLREQTEGNPFFIGEVLRHLVESGAVSVVDGRWSAAGDAASLPIPEGVKEVIGRRLTRLSDAANDLLTVGAVLGRDFDLDVVTRVTDVDADAAVTALDAAVAARLVIERPEQVGRYHFVHALVRETLYEELTAARRSRLHRRAAVVFEELHPDPKPVLAQLAYHYGEAAQAGDVDKAVDYARRAGQSAIDAVGYEEAAGYFERALHALELLDRPNAQLQTELLIDLGDAYDRMGDRDAAEASYEQAMTLARETGDGDAFGRAAVAWVGGWEPGAVRPERVAVLDEALDRLPPGDSATKSMVLSKLATELYFAGDPERVVALHSEAVAMARRVEDPLALGIVLAFFPNYDQLRNCERWLAQADEAIEAGFRANDAKVIQQGRKTLMFTLVELGDMDRFDRELLAAEELAARVRVPAYAWYVPLWQATRAIMQGRLGRGEELALQALALGTEADDPGALQMFGVQLYALRVEQGNVADVEAGVRGLAEQYPTIPAWRTALALALAESGQPDEARHELEVVLRDGVGNFPVDGSWPIAMGVLVDAWDSLGDEHPEQKAAYDLLVPARHRFVNVGWASDAYGSVERLLGVLSGHLAQWDLAEAHFRAGFAADERTGGTRMLARGHWQLAKMRLRRGDERQARSVAQAGLELVQGLELPVVTERLRAMAG